MFLIAPTRLAGGFGSRINLCGLSALHPTDWFPRSEFEPGFGDGFIVPDPNLILAKSAGVGGTPTGSVVYHAGMIAALLTVALMPDITSKEVEFQGDGLKLKGVYSYPTGAEHAPAVLILPGSGPTDRDGNQPGFKTDLLKEISENLNQAGYAVLRFDKRPVARYSEFWPKDPKKLSAFFGMEPHLNDVRAAYKFLAEQPNIDPKRLGLIGHSEGAMFTMALAGELKPAAIALLAGPGRGMDVILTEQIERSVAKMPDQELAETILANLKSTLAALKAKAETPENIHPALAALFNPSTIQLWHDYLNFDPLTSVTKYPGPALIMNGQDDIQVDFQKDAMALYEARRKQRLRTEIVVLSGSHNFKEVTSGDDLGISGPVNPKIIKLLTEFLNKYLVPGIVKEPDSFWGQPEHGAHRPQN